MTRYRLYIGRTGGQARSGMGWSHAEVVDAAASTFTGFTAFDAQGTWQGEREPSTVLEVLVEATPEACAATLAAARHLCKLFGQDCVLVTRDEVDTVLIHPNPPE